MWLAREPVDSNPPTMRAAIEELELAELVTLDANAHKDQIVTPLNALHRLHNRRSAPINENVVALELIRPDLDVSGVHPQTVPSDFRHARAARRFPLHRSSVTLREQLRPDMKRTHAVSSLRRRIAAAALSLAAAGAALTAASGAAEAAPELPRITTTGDTFGTFGDHDYCHGAVRVSLTAAPRTTGTIRVTLTSLGFTGNGPGWVRNPQCRVLFVTTHTSGNGIARENFIPATFGTRPGQKAVRDIRTGAGAVILGIRPMATNSPVRTPQGFGATEYVWVPR